VTETNSKQTALAYIAAGVSSLVALAALGHQAITTSDANRASGDAALQVGIDGNRERIKQLEDARVEMAYQRGVSDQTLNQLSDKADTNSERITESFKELDSKLQREQQLIEAKLLETITATDKRLQDEIARGQRERHEALDALRAELAKVAEQVRANTGAIWTRDEQATFERQMGLVLERAKP